VELCHHDSATKSRDEEDRNAGYELDSLCRSDSAYRKNHEHGNGKIRAEQQWNTANAPTMMTDDDRNDGESFPGRCTKKCCREN